VEPVAQLRLRGTEGDATLRIDTGGLRPSLLHYVRAVYVNGRRVPPRALSDEAGVLVAPLPKARSDAAFDVTILARPLEPGSSGPIDPRRLGLPVFSVEVEPARS
jgi:hypothetical protein